MARLGIALRPAEPSDAPVLRELYHEWRRPEFARLGWSWAAVDQLLDDQLRLQTAHFERPHPVADRLIVTQGAQAAPIGRLLIDRETAPWHLVDIIVAAEHRGRGIGTVLLRWLQRAARRTDAGGVSLHVAHHNAGAAALYRRLGFVEAEAGDTHRRLVWPVS